jgi:hypothetical protein
MAVVVWIPVEDDVGPAAPDEDQIVVAVRRR